MSNQKFIKRENLLKIVVPLLSVVVFINFWIFSRFTVDDAFITWRYGKNLINHGIWNYNPSSYDMTQGYTNPLFAFLSIIPAYFHIDTVLFFKIFSIITIIAFSLWYCKKVKCGAMYLLFAFMLPETMIHAFSGIETFLFVGLSTALIISIYEESDSKIIFFSALLFYTRPESLTLLMVIPLLYCNWQSIGYRSLLKFKNYKFSMFLRISIRFTKKFITVKSVVIFSILLLFLLPNMVISYLNFHSILPNTFFVKNTSFFSLKRFAYYCIALLPLFIMIRYISLNKFVSIVMYFGFMILQYAKTDFVMDYSFRSLYHILFPIVFFALFLIGRSKNHTIKITDIETGLNWTLWYKKFSGVFILIVLCFFFSRESISGLANLSNYYYRALSAHAEAGKIINRIKDKYDIYAVSCGDAGMLAFNADVDSLDLLELGSASLTHNGIEKTYPLYNPDVIFLHGNAFVFMEGVFEEVKNMSQSFTYLGKITWQKDYYLWVYSKKDLPELSAVFERSYEVNFKGNWEIIKEHIFYPPWSQWHE